ncbi:MAG: tRNA (adenosine(37)-N6)-threonylcarbamoyltransferase complex ATPase subunit type 1 TsaE [Actinobacteria bacterium]|nr:tRNA (adenosine(37)-N6)-threonylcarbamoyltransferase complex ATPase subunit type 1 TsaE [Actinomycetota bacterium]
MVGAAVVVESRAVTLDELEGVGLRLARAIRPGDLVVLYGPLGAGKTTFVRAVARGLEVTDPVRSPSFTIANVYSGRVQVQHLDLYRLDEIDDADVLALEEYVNGDAVTLVEWPEAGIGRLGQAVWTVRLAHRSLDVRSLTVEAGTEEARRRWEEAASDE